jgi:DNA-binding transcriptional MocR family regulator
MAEMAAIIDQNLHEFRIIFLHSALDDAGLSCAAFRVLAHLSRRANGRLAYPGIESMARTCRINRKTVREALKEIEARKMIVRVFRPGKSSTYNLTGPSQWTGMAVATDPSQNRATHEADPSRNRATTPPETGLPPLPKQGHEGDPLKEIQEGYPRAGAKAPAGLEAKKQIGVFLGAWKSSYLETYGDTYTVTPQDAQAVKQAVAGEEFGVGHTMNVARMAWRVRRDQRFFYCKHSASIAGLLKFINNIKDELRSAGQLASSAKSSRWNDIGKAHEKAKADTQAKDQAATPG